MGIYSIKKFGLTSNRGRDRVGVGIRSSYIRVLGIQVDTDGSGELALGPWHGPARRCAAPWAEPLSSLQGYCWASCLASPLILHSAQSPWPVVPS